MSAPLRHHRLESGFEIWTPSAPPEGSVFEIVGQDYSQVLEVHLAPGQVVTAEPGTMLYTSSGINLNADIGGMGQGCKRCCCAGESLFRLHLENKTGGVERVALTPNFPAKVVPINLQQYPGMVFNAGAFLAALGTNWKVNLRAVNSAGVCCCGGQGLFMNTLYGDNMVFLNAGGTVLTKQLAAGEELVVDKHAVLAFESSVNLGIRRTGGFVVCCCAGQGLFNAVLTGPGFVMLHSMSKSRLARAFPTGGGGGGDGGNSGGSS